jgi:hypothetical protein
MSYNVKNYTEQGGEKTVIGGTLEIKEGASVTGLPSTPAVISAATDAAIGGIIADAKTAGDTVEGKIGDDNKLYVPTYPVMPEQAVVANQADSTAVDEAGLVTDFNALLAKLKAAGLMTAD